MGKIKTFMKSILPGLFLVGLNIGTGSVTAMSNAGADYGLDLLWTIAISCYITYFLIKVFGRFTIVTGETALHSFKEYIHPVFAGFFVVALTINVCGSIMGVIGVISDVCYHWSLSYTPGGVPAIYFAGFFIGVVYLIFLVGKSSMMERIMGILVALMSLAFLANLLILSPSAGQVLSGLIPQIPGTVSAGGQTPYLVVASMVGTTVFSGLFIIRTVLVRDSGWTLKDLKVQNRDAAISSLIMFIISFSIMAAAATGLHQSGLRLENTSQMLSLLEPLAGSFAVVFFVIGIVAAGVSSQLPNVLLPLMMISDYKNQDKLNLKKTSARLVVLILSIFGLVVPLFNARPIILMVLSQAFGALLLPFTVAAMLFLGNKKRLMGEYSFGLISNVQMVLILFFALFISVNSLMEMFAK